MLSLSFKDVYWVFRDRCMGPISGPLNITSPKAVWCLIRYIGEPVFYVNWFGVVAHFGREADVFYLLLTMASRLQRSVLRARAVAAVH